MTSEPLPPQYLRAGEEYLAALETLGLHPEFLGWGQQMVTRQWILALVTSAVEIGGPLAMSRLLFRAYNMKATPKEISPFIVRVIGRKTILAPHLIELNRFRPGIKGHKVDKVTMKQDGPEFTIESMGQDFGDLHIETRDVYQLDLRKRSHEQKTREWLRFKSSVDKLAA